MVDAKPEANFDLMDSPEAVIGTLDSHTLDRYLVNKGYSGQEVADARQYLINIREKLGDGAGFEERNHNFNLYGNEIYKLGGIHFGVEATPQEILKEMQAKTELSYKSIEEAVKKCDARGEDVGNLPNLQKYTREDLDKIKAAGERLEGKTEDKWTAKDVKPALDLIESEINILDFPGEAVKALNRITGAEMLSKSVDERADNLQTGLIDCNRAMNYLGAHGKLDAIMEYKNIDHQQPLVGKI